MVETPHVWALVDDRAGHAAQVLGLVGRLGFPYEIKRLDYNLLAALPNRFKGASRLGINWRGTDPLRAPWPDLVVSAGRRTAPVARWIKKQHPQARLLHIMWPGEPLEDFDWLVVPAHDDLPERPGLLRTKAALHGVTAELLAKASEAWGPVLGALPAPRIALLIGGSGKHGGFRRRDGEAMLAIAKQMAGQGSLLATTSRRTEVEISILLQEELKEHYYLHLWGERRENPYYGYLALADMLIVTGDSVSMISEAIATGKPVYIHTPASGMDTKLTRFHEMLYASNYARPLGADMQDKWEPAGPLDEARKIVDIITKALQQCS